MCPTQYKYLKNIHRAPGQKEDSESLSQKALLLQQKGPQCLGPSTKTYTRLPSPCEFVCPIPLFLLI